jgi:brefeldin A-inhibited guanine nucleotide-exchange protein
LIDSGFVASREPKEVALFLLNTDGLNKTRIGEFLGEGEESNIATMHAFVDEMDFANTNFVEALREFLQHFRLPGEAQKIDRFMLKFAERYLKGNATAFSSADTAYILAYSVIMLNTDQYNPQVKKKMTKLDFVKNNRGIDEGKDLDPAVLEEMFDEIAAQEIVLKDEQLARFDSDEGQQDGKYRTRKEIEQIGIANENMALKTEAMFNTKSATESLWYQASHYEHVKSMMDIIWMSVLVCHVV